jgi:hypothetical protein
MSDSHCRILAGRARAGASTGRGELRLRHTVATETATLALVPTVSREARGAVALVRIVLALGGVDDEPDVSGVVAPHDPSSIATATAPTTAATSAPTLRVTSRASVCSEGRTGSSIHGRKDFGPFSP